MVEYVPAPSDLSRLNPIQRYMQKGQLDKQDYFYLCLIVLIYFMARPKIEEFFKWWMSPKALREGEQARAEYMQKAKVGPNVIRGIESTSLETIPEVSVDTTSGTNVDKKGKVVNRKTKEKSGADKLLDWEDEPERKPTEGDKADIVAWLDKWSNEE
ncbi:hypothetical protein AYL99_02788 [Fonsecaea erecta]|uniref:Uncharacterized protein n=1 Tax=Fonsecaea erecta TaxID=1367422 RepID=A0A178ZVT0_9EURO|nr:hypothetical protein AYL99_02788 [Fonsecaea erecta]OAP63561.1 hypothetical protein AYL99_02788 [Fonsecaea erecta]